MTTASTPTRLTYGFAQSNGVVLTLGPDGHPVCQHRSDSPLDALLEAQRVSGALLRFEAIANPAFEAALGAIYRDSASAAAQVAADADDDLVALADTAASVDDLLAQNDDAPVVRLINALLLEAVKEGASDVHIETEERRLVVRFRIDGSLREVITPKRALAPLLVSRIKVMGRLDIAEKRLPQDGRVSLRVGGYDLDVRVSTIPSQFGERVVLRLLDRGQTLRGIDYLGLSLRDNAVLRRILARPDGLVLVTGPTGSGKTTTLYAGLDLLNDRQRNIMTVEDPIEYTMDGVGQMQVNPKTDLSFARGLRAILRQDPDVIMVGEIRDRETAQTAVEASLTGHLVMSTLHTNSAPETVTRLLDMGLDPFNFGDSLLAVLAQRLVRRLCPHCRAARNATNDEVDELLHDWLHVFAQDGAPSKDQVLAEWRAQHGQQLMHWQSKGCASCEGSGLRGRAALHELMTVTRELRRLIQTGARAEQLQQQAMSDGMRTLRQDGIDKVLAGVTSIAEVRATANG